MNNWRLLLLAVIAVLQPIPSFTEGNLIDGRRECCDHRSNSIAPDIRIYGTFGKSGLEDRRLDSRVNREGQRQEDATTRSRERQALERNERRFSPSLARLSTDSRFARDQERRSRYSSEARDGENRRIQDTRATDNYERDVATTRRIRMSRDDIRTDLRNERPYRASDDTRRVRSSNELRRVSSTEETMAVLRRERDDVTRFQRDSRFSSISRLQLYNTRDRTLASRRNYEKENRVSRSLISRVKSDNEREERRYMDRITGERRQRDQTLGSTIRTNAIRRASVDRVLDNRNIGERVDRLNRGLAERRSIERQNDDHEQRNDNRLARERLVLRESTYAERRPGSVAITRRADSERRETTENISRLSRSVTTERDERLSRHRRDVRGMERFDASRQRESRRVRSIDRVSRDDVRKQEIRNESRIRDQRNYERNDVDRREHEERSVSREQIINRVVRDNERRQERESSRVSILARRQSSVERISRNREDTARDDISDSRRVRHSRQRMTLYVELRQNSHLRNAEHIRGARSQTAEILRINERRDMSRERDDMRESRDRISTARVSRDRVEDQRRETRRITRDSRQQRGESRGTTRDSRTDIQRETRNRGDVRTGERFEVRRDNNRVNRDRVSLQRSTDIRAERSSEERRDISTRNRDTNIQSESNRDDRRVNERLARNNPRDIRVAKPVFRQMGEREDQEHRHTERLQDKVRSIDSVFDVRSDSKNVRYDTRLMKRETMEIRSRNLDTAEEMTENQSMNWQMVFYTLQGAYLCGLLMKMLTEKSNKGKTRNFTWWTSPKALVKVD